MLNQLEVAPYRILIVDDDEDLRVSLTRFFELENIQVTSAASMAKVRALGRLALDCDLAILDINLGPDSPSGLEVFDWLSDQHFKGNVAFLTGHAKGHPLVAQAMSLRGVTVYEKPQGVFQLLEIVREKAKPNTPEARAHEK